MKTYKFIFNKEILKDVVTALKDLAKIDPMIKIKFDEEHILFYSKSGTMHSIKAFKSFMFNTDELIISKETINIDFIILNGKNFVDNLSIMLSKDNDVACKISYNEGSKNANMMEISNGSMKFKFVSGDYTQIKDISKLEIATKMNPDLSNFDFTINKEIFTDIKKLSKLNKSEIINFKVKNNTVYFFDKKWQLQIDTVDYEDGIYTFNNKYIQSINMAEEIKINVFEHFILIKDGFVTLLIGLELSEL